MRSIKTKQPTTSINASSHPQATRVQKEEYLIYAYPHLTLYEDISSGMARKTKYYVVLNDKEGTTIYVERGDQHHNTHFKVAHPAFEGEWFSSAFVAAKALSDYIENGHR